MKKYILASPLLFLLLSFTKKAIPTIVVGEILTSYEVKAQSRNLTLDDTVLFRTVSWTPTITTFGDNISFDGGNNYFPGPRIFYNTDIDNLPLISNVGYSGDYRDLQWLPQLPNPGYAINTYGNEWNVDSAYYPTIRVFNNAITTLSNSALSTSLSITGLNLSIKSGSTTINTISIPNQTTSLGTAAFQPSTSFATSAQANQTVTMVGVNGLTVTGTYPTYTVTSKRRETYSGTTDASGNYTVTFGTAYSVAPNIQANLTGNTSNQYIKIVSVSTTGFIVNAYAFTTNTVLGIVNLTTTTTNLASASVDVVINEK